MTGPRLFMAAALLLGTGLALAVPGAALETAGAESNATSEVVTQQHASPAFANRLFHVEWSAGAAGRDQSRIFGYAYSDYRVDAVNVHLRITGLDESGRPIASIVQPVGETVRAGGRAFFDRHVPGNARSYRVTVESFDFMADGEWETQTTQQWLAAAGFEKKVADTPEKLTHLETLTPVRTSGASICR